MRAEPGIFQLDNNGDFFVIRDRRGQVIASGTREICEVLVHIINEQASHTSLGDSQAPRVKEDVTDHRNLRSAITF